MPDITDIIKNMKTESRAAAEALALRIPTEGTDGLMHLLPVGAWILNDLELVRSIQAWRQRDRGMFLTQFQGNFDSTLAYLRYYAISEPYRLLFIITAADGSALGHMGLMEASNSSAEVDNVMRGESTAPRGIMTRAQRRLLDWCFQDLALTYCKIRVLSYNTRAIKLYERLGFRIESRQYLLRTEADGVIYHVVCESKQSNVDYWCYEMRATSRTTTCLPGSDSSVK